METLERLWLVCVGTVALPMANTSGVEGRLRAILLPKRRQTMITRMTVALAATVTLGVLVPLASLRIASRAQAGPVTPHPTVRMTKANAAVSAVHAVPGETDAHQLLTQGRSLTPEAVAMLNKSLATSPDDLAAHIQLLGYYSPWLSHRKGWKDYDAQIFWLIQKHPASTLLGSPDTLILEREDPAGFRQSKTLWLAQVFRYPHNTVILDKAAEFCLLSDKSTTERLLEQGAAEEPQNPKWPNRLGELYQLQVRLDAPPTVQRQWAQKALAAYQAAAALDGAQADVNGDFEKLSLSAYDAGKYLLAGQYADRLLGDGGRPQNYDADGNIHHANMILGLLALRGNNRTQAEQYLQAMGNISGSPSLDSFGPNMRLAQALLEQGDRQPVLDYFAECAKFWTNDSGQLKEWTAQVQQDKMPNFSANLYY